jgi:hypothetical protein
LLWSATYETSHDEHIKANAAAHLRALQADHEVTELEQLVETYRQRTGHLPVSFAEMAAGGYLRGAPVDPVGNTYKLTPNGRVQVREPDQLPFLQKGLPLGYTAPAVPNIKPVN